MFVTTPVPAPERAGRARSTQRRPQDAGDRSVLHIGQTNTIQLLFESMKLISTLKSLVKAWLSRTPGRLEAVIDSFLAARVVLRKMKRALLAVDSRLWKAYLHSTATKLHIGCGEHLLPGWLNTDYFPASPHVMHLNAAENFFFPHGSFETIYSEHLIEHLTERGGHTMLAECFRVLKPGGTIRIATPNLERLIDVYSRPDSGGNRNYINWSLEHSIRDVVSRSPLAVFNQLLRGWGHLFLYDRAGLHAALRRAGFDGIVECSVGQSGTKCMVGLENDSRMPSGLYELETMIFEARKPSTGDV